MRAAVNTGASVHSGALLSAVLYDAEWRYREHISYTNLRSESYRACHSGDITSAPEGACEFIDIDIPSVVAYGGRSLELTRVEFDLLATLPR